jgi:hypothetical protein
MVRFKAVPGGVDHLGRDGPYRLKLLLKRAWRDLGLRAEAVWQVEGEPARESDPQRVVVEAQR